MYRETGSGGTAQRFAGASAGASPKTELVNNWTVLIGPDAASREGEKARLEMLWKDRAECTLSLADFRDFLKEGEVYALTALPLYNDETCRCAYTDPKDGGVNRAIKDVFKNVQAYDRRWGSDDLHVIGYRVQSVTMLSGAENRHFAAVVFKSDSGVDATLRSDPCFASSLVKAGFFAIGDKNSYVDFRALTPSKGQPELVLPA